MFRATGAGFQVTFDNGWTISVQWGPGGYCDNRMKSLDMEVDGMKSRNAEIAAWNEDDIWWDFGTQSPVEDGTSIQGYVKPDELIGYIQEISSITMSRVEAQFASANSSPEVI